MDRRLVDRLRRRLGVVVLAAFVVACGSDGSTIELSDDDPTVPAPTTAPASAPAALVACGSLPDASTDVIGDGSIDVGDPLVLGVMQTYAAEHPDTFGGLWIDREARGTIVLGFTDDPERHRQALRGRAPSPDDVEVVSPRPPIDDDRTLGERGDVVFDVVRVDHSEQALRATSDQVVAVALGSDLGIGGVGTDIMRSRVSLSADDGRITTAEVDELTDLLTAAGVDTSMLCLDGSVSDGPAPEPDIAIGDELDVIVLPDPDGTFPPGTRVECTGTEFDLGDLATMRPLDEVHPDLRSVLETWLASEEGAFWEQGGWRLLSEADGRAQFISVADDGGVSFVGAELGENGWIWAGAGAGGPCDVRRVLPAGLSPVDWELDPTGGDPSAETTELRVLATERSCTGGSEIGDRLLGPDVVETDDAVRIVLAAIPLTGDQTCPGNPSTPVTIQLDAPLGDRAIIDGLVVGPLSELIDP